VWLSPDVRKLKAEDRVPFHLPVLGLTYFHSMITDQCKRIILKNKTIQLEVLIKTAQDSVNMYQVVTFFISSAVII